MIVTELVDGTLEHCMGVYGEQLSTGTRIDILRQVRGRGFING